MTDDDLRALERRALADVRDHEAVFAHLRAAHRSGGRPALLEAFGRWLDRERLAFRPAIKNYRVEHATDARPRTAIILCLDAQHLPAISFEVGLAEHLMVDGYVRLGDRPDARRACPECVPAVNPHTGELIGVSCVRAPADHEAIADPGGALCPCGHRLSSHGSVTGCAECGCTERQA